MSAAPDDYKDKYFELRIDSLEKITLLRFELEGKALALQAGAYDVHLLKLNHEQARLLADRERYLQKEVHEEWKREVDLFREGVTKTLATSAGRATAFAVGCSLATGVVVALLTLFYKL